jgi:hypothetical protein
MTIWQLVARDAPRFAEAGRRGAWSETAACSRCGRPTKDEDGEAPARVQPLIVAWEPGSDVIADFTELGFGADWLVRAEVLEAMAARFEGFECGPVGVHMPGVRAAGDAPRRSRRNRSRR